jgi:hypothetical protein
LEKRIEIFDAKVKEIAQEKVKMGDLLAGDRKRTMDLLEQLAEGLRGDSRRHLGELISRAVQNHGNLVVTEGQTRDRIAEEVPVFFAAKLASVSSEVNHALQKLLLPYQERLDELVNTLRSTAAELFEVPYRASPSNGRLEELHRPYWVTQKWNTSISPVPEGFLDRFLPPELRKHRLQKRLDEEVETLVTRNVENIRWATLRNLDDAFRRFSSTLDEGLKETAEATLGAMRAAQLRREHSEDTIQPELERLEKKAADLMSIESALIKFADSTAAEA